MESGNDKFSDLLRVLRTISTHCRLLARMEARHQISQAQFAAGRHYQGLHEAAFARALHSLDLAAPVIEKNRYGIEPFSDRQGPQSTGCASSTAQ